MKQTWIFFEASVLSVESIPPTALLQLVLTEYMINIDMHKSTNHSKWIACHIIFRMFCLPNRMVGDDTLIANFWLMFMGFMAFPACFVIGIYFQQHFHQFWLSWLKR